MKKKCIAPWELPYQIMPTVPRMIGPFCPSCNSLLKGEEVYIYIDGVQCPCGRKPDAAGMMWCSDCQMAFDDKQWVMRPELRLTGIAE